MAFPATVWKPIALPTGIWLGVVPPSSEVVDIELSWRTTGSTSFDYLETLSGQTAQGRYSYIHGLPLSTQRYYYRARSIANGKTPSTYLEVSARPVELPMLPYGPQTANENVLGEELRVRVTGLDMRPLLHNTVGEYVDSALTMNAAGDQNFGCSVKIPVGARMVRFVARGRGYASSTGHVDVQVKITDNDGGYFVAGGVISLATTSYVTSTGLSTPSDPISVDKTVTVTARVVASGIGNQPRLAWADIYYVANSYMQVRA